MTSQWGMAMGRDGNMGITRKYKEALLMPAKTAVKCWGREKELVEESYYPVTHTPDHPGSGVRSLRPADSQPWPLSHQGRSGSMTAGRSPAVRPCSQSSLAQKTSRLLVPAERSGSSPQDAVAALESSSGWGLKLEATAGRQ